MTEKKLTSYCGLYCIDCIPSKQCLFENLQKFEQELGNLGFEKYAQIKAEKTPAFKKYSDFLEVLSEIKNLECKRPAEKTAATLTAKSVSAPSARVMRAAGNAPASKPANCLYQ